MAFAAAEFDDDIDLPGPQLNEQPTPGAWTGAKSLSRRWTRDAVARPRPQGPVWPRFKPDILVWPPPQGQYLSYTVQEWPHGWTSGCAPGLKEAADVLRTGLGHTPTWQSPRSTLPTST